MSGPWLAGRVLAETETDLRNVHPAFKWSSHPEGWMYDRAPWLVDPTGLPNLILFPPPYHPLEVLAHQRGCWGVVGRRSTIHPGFLAYNQVRAGGWKAVCDAYAKACFRVQGEARVLYHLFTPLLVNADDREALAVEARKVLFGKFGVPLPKQAWADRYDQEFWRQLLWR